MILRLKIVFHNKIINKTRSTKNQENSTHRFGDNYRANHLVKFWKIGLNHEELKLLKHALVIPFLKENR